jgi:ABC-type ATPase involved in cell division
MRKKNLLELMYQANARGTTVLVATHDERLYLGSRRRILELAKGRLGKSAGGKV